MTANAEGVELDGLGKTYGGAGGVVAIEAVSTTVHPGEFVSVLGPSGCGKSTLLLMIGGLLSSSGGSVRVGGTEVVAPNPDMGFVFQRPTLLPWRSVLDNVLFPVELQRRSRADYREHALQLIEMAGLSGTEQRLPAQLSGGMQQRVALCRALVLRPKLLLMDEPFSALDALTRDQMAAELLDLWQRFRNTVIFVTHSIREAVYLSDRVMVMSRRPGRVVLDRRIELARPREISLQETPEFNGYVAELRGALTA